MELSPNSSPAETSEKSGEKKAKKKSAEALGSFAVLPETKKSDTPKPEALFSFDRPEQKPSEEKPNKDELPLESLSDDEVIDAYKAIAHERSQELDSVPLAQDEATLQAEAAVAAFIERTEVTGNPEVAASEVAEERGIEYDPSDEVQQEDEVATPSSAGGNSPPPPHTPPTRGTGPASPGPAHGGGTNRPAAVPLQTIPLAPTAPVPTTPNIFNANQIEPAYNTGVTDGLIVGGLVGYFVGRRRGRIKTEKRLKPVQEKLEKQVVQLKKEVATKEAVIRQAAARKYREALPVVAAVPVKAKAERIGHVLVAAERPTVAAPAKPERAIKVAKPEQLTTIQERVQALNREELLATSQKIMVEGTSLRQVYETSLISEKALRRLVVEHLKGGDVARLLRMEIVEREIDFERDPRLRDKARKAISKNDRGTSSTLVQQVGSMVATKVMNGTLQQPQNMPSFSKAEVKKGQMDGRKVADIALVTIISLLVIAIGYTVAN